MGSGQASGGTGRGARDERGDVQTRPEDLRASHARRLPSWNVLVGVHLLWLGLGDGSRLGKRKTERKADGGKADRPDQKQARPLREKEPW